MTPEDFENMKRAQRRDLIFVIIVLVIGFAFINWITPDPIPVPTGPGWETLTNGEG